MERELFTKLERWMNKKNRKPLIIHCNKFHGWFSFLKKKSSPCGKPLLHVSDILRFAAPRRLRRLNIHVHHILAVMTGWHFCLPVLYAKLCWFVNQLVTFNEKNFTVTKTFGFTVVPGASIFVQVELYKAKRAPYYYGARFA